MVVLASDSAEDTASVFGSVAMVDSFGGGGELN